MTHEEMIRLNGTVLAPYIQIATALIGKHRRTGGNMFRHQLDTMAILIDYGYIDSVLLKASIVHDVIEDIEDFNHNIILNIDFESFYVYNLVLEVTRTPDETKAHFLTKILENGSRKAKILKVADRISNMISLGSVDDPAFVARYSNETERYIFPMAEEVDLSMLAELEYLVESRRKSFVKLVNT
ncbi:hypothetical protein PilKf_01091 [Pillotina sp. SPG140]|jgi:(p)ppGpp synthase/HD superfamily hydrolase